MEQMQEMEEGVFYTTPEIYEWFKKKYAELYQYYVYVHTSPDGKKYVGYGKGKPEDRWNYGNGYRHNRRFWEAIQQFGWGSFQHEIIKDGLCLEEARELERETILAMETWKKDKGYNVSIPKKYEDEEHYSVYQLIFPDNKMYVGKCGVPRMERDNSEFGIRNSELSAAAEALGVDKSAVGAHLRGKSKTVKGVVLRAISNAQFAMRNSQLSAAAGEINQFAIRNE